MRQENNFDFLRLLGASLVFYCHQYALSGRPQPVMVAPEISLGTLGVLIFFSISGFLVASSWQSDPNLGRFAVRRMLRIWPALAFVVACSALLAAALKPTERQAALQFLTNAAFIPADGNFFTTNKYPMLNGSLWTIPIEVKCYVVLACVGFLTGRYLKQALAVSFAALLVHLAPLSDKAMTEAAVQMGNPTYVWWLGGFFLFGALLRCWPALRMHVLVWCTAGGVLFALGHTSLGLLLALPPIAVAIGSRSWPVLRRAGRFGDLSYGIYVFAWPVQQSVSFLLGAEKPLALLFFASAIVTLLLAFASWHLLEKQALKLKPGSSPALIPAAS